MDGDHEETTSVTSWAKAWVPGQVVWAYRGPGKGWWPAVVPSGLSSRHGGTVLTTHLQVGGPRPTRTAEGIVPRAPAADKGFVRARLLGKAKEYPTPPPVVLLSSGANSYAVCRKDAEGTQLLPFDDPRLPEGLCEGFAEARCRHGSGQQLLDAIHEARQQVAKQVCVFPAGLFGQVAEA
jgi:hypothetical protein